MTAIVINRYDNGFQIVSDGSCYDDQEYRLAYLASKVSSLAIFSGFVAMRGTSNVGPLFKAAAENGFLSFDHLIERAGDVARQVATLVQHLNGGAAPRFTFYLGGWSESREAFEVYAISPDDRDDPLHGVARRAFEVTLVPGAVLAPCPPSDTAEELGLLVTDAGETLPDFRWHRLPLWIHAARIGKSDDGHCQAGGFIEETWIKRDQYQSNIIYRYDDTIGLAMFPDDKETDEILALCEARGENGLATAP